jgi:hypothetical protein
MRHDNDFSNADSVKPDQSTRQEIESLLTPLLGTEQQRLALLGEAFGYQSGVLS